MSIITDTGSFPIILFLFYVLIVFQKNLPVSVNTLKYQWFFHMYPFTHSDMFYFCTVLISQIIDSQAVYFFINNIILTFKARHFALSKIHSKTEF